MRVCKHGGLYDSRWKTSRLGQAQALAEDYWGRSTQRDVRPRVLSPAKVVREPLLLVAASAGKGRSERIASKTVVNECVDLSLELEQVERAPAKKDADGN